MKIKPLWLVFFLNSKFSILFQRNRTVIRRVSSVSKPMATSFMANSLESSRSGVPLNFARVVLFSFQQKVIEGSWNVSCHADMLTIASLALPLAASHTYTHTHTRTTVPLVSWKVEFKKNSTAQSLSLLTWVRFPWNLLNFVIWNVDFKSVRVSQLANCVEASVRHEVARA